MKNIKFTATLIALVFVAQYSFGQNALNNGRLTTVQPQEVAQQEDASVNSDVAQEGVYPVDFDYNNPSEQQEAANQEDNFYPVQLQVMEEEIMASTNPAIIAEKVNELNAMIGDLRRLTEELRLENKIIRESLGNCCSNSELGLSAEDAYLVQNAPNPFNASAEINYFIPDGLNNAEIRICNFKGEVLRSMAIEDAGYGKINVDASDLNAGSLIYMLAVEGEIIDSKVMVITK